VFVEERKITITPRTGEGYNDTREEGGRVEGRRERERKGEEGEGRGGGE